MKVVPGGTATTVAGSGTAGFSGDGGSAVTAQLNLPTGAVMDAAGNLYIADAANYCIRKVTPRGTISTVAGNLMANTSGDGGPATAAYI